MGRRLRNPRCARSTWFIKREDGWYKTPMDRSFNGSYGQKTRIPQSSELGKMGYCYHRKFFSRLPFLAGERGKCFRDSNLTGFWKLFWNTRLHFENCGKIHGMGLDLSVRGSTVPAAFNRGNRTKDQNCAWLSEIIEIVFYPKCTENSGMCYEVFVKCKLEKIWCMLEKHLELKSISQEKEWKSTS